MKSREKHTTKRLKSAFTLAEVMTATAVTVVLMTLVLGMLVAVVKVHRRAEIKNSVSDDYRELTRRIVEQGNISNGYFIYDSFSNAHSNSGNATVPPGSSGDMVVFIFYSVKDIKTNPNIQGVSRILGAYRENPENISSPIRWFDSARHNWGQTFSPKNPVVIPADGAGLKNLIPPAAYIRKCAILAEHTLGAPLTSNGKSLNLFYNEGRSVYITGFIKRSNAGTDYTATASGIYESLTAFNLTVSPRSQ